MSPQPLDILIYRMMVSTHPTNSGRTFAISIFRSNPMHLHGWKVQWSHRLWCRLHSVNRKSTGSRDRNPQNLTLCSDATRVSTPHGNGHPSKLRPLTMQVNYGIKWSFYEHVYAVGTRGLFFFKLLICTVEIFLLINAAFIFINNQNLLWNYFFFVLYSLNKIIYKVINKLRLLILAHIVPSFATRISHCWGRGGTWQQSWETECDRVGCLKFVHDVSCGFVMVEMRPELR